MILKVKVRLLPKWLLSDLNLEPRTPSVVGSLKKQASTILQVKNWQNRNPRGFRVKCTDFLGRRTPPKIKQLNPNQSTKHSSRPIQILLLGSLQTWAPSRSSLLSKTARKSLGVKVSRACTVARVQKLRRNPSLIIKRRLAKIKQSPVPMCLWLTTLTARSRARLVRKILRGSRSASGRSANASRN